MCIRQRIRENIGAHARGEDATYLDLGNCGMTKVPEEICTLDLKTRVFFEAKSLSE
jgi:hypothetical protein